MFFSQIFSFLFTFLQHLFSYKTELASCTVANYKLMSTKTDYDLVSSKQIFGYQPSGCKPIGVWHLIRHGARYPDSDDIVKMNKGLPQLRDRILDADVKAKNEWLCERDRVELRKWKTRMLPEFDNNLTPNGQKRMAALAQRMRLRLAGLVETIESDKQIRAQATLTNRTGDSADEYLNAFAAHLSQRPVVKISPQSEDFLLKFPDLCQRYLKEIDLNKNACEETKQFDAESVQYKMALGKFGQRINVTVSSNELLELFGQALKMCQYEYLIDATNSVWCKFFDKDMLKTLEYREDIKYHCKYGYKYNISRLMACDLVNNLLQSLDEYKKGFENNDKTAVKATLLFTHSSSVLPFYAAMNIGQNPNNFNFSNISSENSERSYKVSRMDPMNSNIAFVLYKCDDSASNSSSRYTVKAFHNEFTIKVPGCVENSTDCRLESLLGYLNKLVAECQSTQNVCNN